MVTSPFTLLLHSNQFHPAGCCKKIRFWNFPLISWVMFPNWNSCMSWTRTHTIIGQTRCYSSKEIISTLLYISVTDPWGAIFYKTFQMDFSPRSAQQWINCKTPLCVHKEVFFSNNSTINRVLQILPFSGTNWWVLVVTIAGEIVCNQVTVRPWPHYARNNRHWEA